MKVIIAKTYEQYVRACHQNCLKVDVVPWVTKAETILQIRGAVEPIFTGDFWKLAECDEIDRALKARGIKVEGERIKVD